MSDRVIDSIEMFISRTRVDSQRWNGFPWFRGEPSVDTPLLPRLYRKKEDGGDHDENRLLQFFRMKAPSLGLGYTPDREATDQWLFLAQHVGLPTRLLDWSEGSLMALYFALVEKEPIVWMLNPIELNNLSLSEEGKVDSTYYTFPLTWVGDNNIGHLNVRGAWEKDKVGTDLPVAIYPTNIHPRMTVQRSCFTIHGKRKECLNKLIDSAHLKRYVINPSKSEEMMHDLRMLGVSQATLFPDLDALAKDLERLF